MEVARRADEQKRHEAIFPDAHGILSVRDLPDPGVDLTEEERELFGIVDGRHTVQEIVAAAPLSEYETYEALHSMVEAGWLEIIGHRDPGAQPAPARTAAAAHAPITDWKRELALAGLMIGALLVLRAGAQALVPRTPPAAVSVFAVAQLRDVRMALDMYRREHAAYPERLEELAETRWLAPDQLRVPGHDLRYRRSRDGLDYTIQLDAP